MVRGEALQDYKDFIRVTRKSFAKDIVMLRKSTEGIHKSFNKNRHVNSDTEIRNSLSMHVLGVFKKMQKPNRTVTEPITELKNRLIKKTVWLWFEKFKKLNFWFGKK
ncbi:hypothetical protein Patl1_19698 [Pistacia atlantica]|uniref:Uncharacterized protein n=1 Tax=Pistacia atlantica TaxID=434234 RepID=A0ACC1C3D0_9ROSI|nr:hypothetical protein Patl1_19698 [Pistacia atlantica]